MAMEIENPLFPLKGLLPLYKPSADGSGNKRGRRENHIIDYHLVSFMLLLSKILQLILQDPMGRYHPDLRDHYQRQGD